jgi:hypothetical protein
MVYSDNFGQRSIDQLAAQHIQLEMERPANKLSDEYRSHMHQIYVLYEEMCRRIGIDNTHDKLNQLRDSYNLLTGDS